MNKVKSSKNVEIEGFFGKKRQTVKSVDFTMRITGVEPA